MIATVSSTSGTGWKESQCILFLLVLELYYDKSITYLEVLRTVPSIRSIPDWMYKVSCSQKEDKFQMFSSFFSRFRSSDVSNLVAGR